MVAVDVRTRGTRRLAGWPDDPQSVDAATAHPEIFADKTVGQIADHVDRIIGQLNRKHTVRVTISKAAFKHQQRNASVTEIVEMHERGHALTIDHGWQEVADTALAFIRLFV